MFIHCGACGRLLNLPHDGTAEEIESVIADTINAGWRYVKSYDGYICPACQEDNPDKLYEMYVGKIKPEGKDRSYMVLVQEMADFFI